MHRRGFTIVELLIVIVVIAILAAVTIVAYNGIQNRAKASAAQSAASQSAKKVMAYAVENADQYPADLAAVGISDSGDTTYQYSVNNAVSPRTYCITATTSNTSYYLSNTSSTPSAGGCPGHSANGVNAITNLVLSPSWELPSPIQANSSNGGTNAVDIVSSTDWSQYGSRSLRITPTSTSNDTAANVAGSASTLSGYGVTFVPGRTYTVTATVYVPQIQSSASGRARAIYYANSVSGWAVGSPHITAAPNAVGTYTLSVTFTIPVTATWAIVRLYNGATSTSGPVYWDGLMITESSVPYSFADGSSAGWVWNGTPHNSTSTGLPL